MSRSFPENHFFKLEFSGRSLFRAGILRKIMNNELKQVAVAQFWIFPAPYEAQCCQEASGMHGMPQQKPLKNQKSIFPGFRGRAGSYRICFAKKHQFFTYNGGCPKPGVRCGVAARQITLVNCCASEPAVQVLRSASSAQGIHPNHSSEAATADSHGG